MSNIFKLNESSGMLEEQPRMKEPNNNSFWKSSIHKMVDDSNYRDHLKSLRSLTILPEHKEHFKAGVEYVEGKDFTIKEHQDKHKCRCPCHSNRVLIMKHVKACCQNGWVMGMKIKVAIPTTEREQEDFVPYIDRVSTDKQLADGIHWAYSELIALNKGKQDERIYVQADALKETLAKWQKELQQLRDYKELAETRRLRIEELEKQSIEDKEAFHGISNTVAGWVEKYGKVLKENERLKHYEAIDNDATAKQIVDTSFQAFDELIPDTELRSWYKYLIATCMQEYAKRFTHSKTSPDARRAAVEFHRWAYKNSYYEIQKGLWTNKEASQNERLTDEELFNLFHPSTGDKNDKS